MKSVVENLSSIFGWPLVWWILWYLTFSQGLFLSAGLLFVITGIYVCFSCYYNFLLSIGLNWNYLLFLFARIGTLVCWVKNVELRIWNIRDKYHTLILNKYRLFDFIKNAIIIISQHYFNSKKTFFIYSLDIIHAFHKIKFLTPE